MKRKWARDGPHKFKQDVRFFSFFWPWRALLALSIARQRPMILFGSSVVMLVCNIYSIQLKSSCQKKKSIHRVFCVVFSPNQQAGQMNSDHVRSGSKFQTSTEGRPFYLEDRSITSRNIHRFLSKDDLNMFFFFVCYLFNFFSNFNYVVEHLSACWSVWLLGVRLFCPRGEWWLVKLSLVSCRQKNNGRKINATHGSRRRLKDGRAKTNRHAQQPGVDGWIPSRPASFSPGDTHTDKGFVRAKPKTDQAGRRRLLFFYYYLLFSCGNVVIVVYLTGLSFFFSLPVRLDI